MCWLPKGLADGDNKTVIVCGHGLNRNGRDFDWIAARKPSEPTQNISGLVHNRI